MNRIRVTMRGAVVSLAAACAAGGGAHGADGSCRPRREGHYEARISYLRDLISSPDSDRIEMRSQIGLALGDPEQVRLVNDVRTCQLAVVAVNVRRETPGLDRSMWVFDLGHGYAVEDPTGHQMGQRIGIEFFDDDFRFLLTVYAF